MSKSLYSKSEELGFDYIEDRYIIDEDYVTTYIELSSCSSFDFEEYIKKCSEAFINLQNTKEYKSFIKSKGSPEFYFGNDPEINLIVQTYETEDDFIRRRTDEIKAELKYKDEKAKLKKEKDKSNIETIKSMYTTLSARDKKKLIKDLGI